MFERILVAIDGATSADWIASQLSYLCDARSTEVVLLHVVEIDALLGIPEPPRYGISSPGLVPDRVRDAEESLALRAPEFRRSGFSTRCEARAGLPAHVIAAVAARERADLVVFAPAATGNEWPEKGVGEQLMRLNRCPLLVLRPTRPVAPDISRRQAAILLPVEEGGCARRALVHAVYLSRRRGAEIVLFHASRDEHRSTRRCLQATSDLLAATGVRSHVVLVSGDPAEEIIRYCDQFPVCLAVLATRGRCGVARWLHRSVTKRVLRSGEMPLVIVNDRTPCPTCGDGVLGRPRDVNAAEAS